MLIRKVLLAEDEEDIQKVAQISLQFRGGWEVALARNGEECLAKAARAHAERRIALYEQLSQIVLPKPAAVTSGNETVTAPAGDDRAGMGT